MSDNDELMQAFLKSMREGKWTQGRFAQANDNTEQTNFCVLGAILANYKPEPPVKKPFLKRQLYRVSQRIHKVRVWLANHIDPYGPREDYW